MPRSLVIGNGSVLATYDEHLLMRDLYYPYVGMEDHTAYGDLHRVGVWVEGKGFSWFNDGSWAIDIRYKNETIVGDSRLRNDRLGLEIIANDFVHPVHNILVRHFRVRMQSPESRIVRFFFHHDLHIYGDKQKDTSFYEPYTNSVIHYRQKRYFLIGGLTSAAISCRTERATGHYQSVLHSREKLIPSGISSWSIGKSDYRGLEGTWKDAEDGVLSCNPIEQGSVDSTINIECIVTSEHETDVTMWMCFGKSLPEVIDLHQVIMHETPDRLERNCHNYWKSWVNKTKHDFGSLSESIINLYKRSLFTIRLHADNRGGIVAAADADIMNYNRDTYTYVWPRDGAFTSMALDEAKYSEVTRRFFEFCARVQTEDGYLLHKYNPDDSFGSSWHPWYREDSAQLPIQEDETALVLVALLKHFECDQDFEFLQLIYERFIKKAAKFLCEFREEGTGLPLQSYDQWEEHRGVITATTATVIAGLNAAAKISHILGHYQHSEHYQTAADETRQAMLFHLYDEDTKRFLKKIKRKDGRTIERDLTPDAGIMLVWKLGVLPIDDPRVISTMTQLRDALTVRTPIGGLARYPNDYYQAVTGLTPDIPGNPWIVTTLWDAQWTINRASTLADLEPARKALEWTTVHATATGLLPEQINPLTGAPLSVSPLTWSHAVFVETVLAFAKKEATLRAS